MRTFLLFLLSFNTGLIVFCSIGFVFFGLLGYTATMEPQDCVFMGTCILVALFAPSPTKEHNETTV